MLAVASAHAMEGQDLDVLNEMSADGSGSNGAQAEARTTHCTPSAILILSLLGVQGYFYSS